MNCYLPWKLNDMTNISAEKLQRNINQQASYIELYKGELVGEALRFNIASILKYACVHRAAFGNDPLSMKASDCLVVFLHAMAFQRNSFFTPSDSETSIQTKGCRNLHRLMLENLKATMRYIDYSVLLDRANGKTDVVGMFQAREDIYSRVFPNEVLLDVCGDESINDGFLSIVDMENSGKGSFIDYDVKNICNMDDSICAMLSLTSSSQDGFGEDSPYGVIADMMQYLNTPFIEHSGRFYSFVTRFSLGLIRSRLAILHPAKEEPCTVEAFEEEGKGDESCAEAVGEEEACVDEACADEVSESEFQEDEICNEPEDDDEDYDDGILEGADFDADDDEYNALVGDDAYSYLDDVPSEEFEPDSLLEEQDSLYDDDEGLDSSEGTESSDEPEQDDPYGERSLFDVCDEEEPSPEVDSKAEPEPELEPESGTVDVSKEECPPVEEKEDAEDAVETAPELEEPAPEPVQKPVQEPAPEPVQEPVVPVSDSLLDRVLKSFAKTNPVVQYVGQCSDEQRRELEDVMEKALSACRSDGHDKMFAIPNTTISVCIFRTTKDPMLEIQRRENVGALMFAGGYDAWNSLELYVNELGCLAKCEYRKVTRFSFSDWEWKVAEKLGQRILDRRGM